MNLRAVVSVMLAIVSDHSIFMGAQPRLSTLVVIDVCQVAPNSLGFESVNWSFEY